MHQRPLPGQDKISGILQRAGGAAINDAGGHQRLVEETQHHESHKHRFVEAGDQVMRLEALKQGRAGMTRRGAEAADEQKPHRHEQRGADADGEGRGLQRYAREEAENDPALRQQARNSHELSGRGGQPRVFHPFVADALRDQERQFQRLAGIEARIAGGVIAVG